MFAHFKQETHSPFHHSPYHALTLPSHVSCQWSVTTVLAMADSSLVEKYIACIYVKSRNMKDLLRSLHTSRKMGEIVQRERQSEKYSYVFQTRTETVENHTWTSQDLGWAGQAGFAEWQPAPPRPLQALVTAC